jgi:hypothetical protein
MKFRKKPVVIEAYKFTGDGMDAMNWAEDFIAPDGINPIVIKLGHGLVVETLEGDIKVSEGDWIICGVNKEFYPCKPDIFDKTYEAVE